MNITHNHNIGITLPKNPLHMNSYNIATNVPLITQKIQSASYNHFSPLISNLFFITKYEIYKTTQSWVTSYFQE